MNDRYAQLAIQRNLYYNGKHIPYEIGLKAKARELRNNATPVEVHLWKYLRRLPFQILRQRIVDHFIVDFYIPSRQLVIEVDGGHHFRTEGKQRDDYRTSVLELYGLRILRYSNADVMRNAEGIAQFVLNCDN